MIRSPVGCTRFHPVVTCIPVIPRPLESVLVWANVEPVWPSLNQHSTDLTCMRELPHPA